MVFNTRFQLSLGLAGMLALTGNASAVEKNPKADSEIIESGRVVYQQYCAVCHDQAEGDSWKKPNEFGDLPPPPHGPDGHTWRHSDASLQRMIGQGWRDPFNKTQALTMPAFQDVLPPEKIDSVILYLKTLWTDEQRQSQLRESQLRESQLRESQLRESQPELLTTGQP